MTEVVSIPDEQTRRLAETTFDRNVVVVAGAGTGKTTLLVNRFIHTLMREPRPLPITQIVAMTFTNKAATEMKARLRERLERIVESGHGREKDDVTGVVRVQDLRELYGLSLSQIVERAEAALGNLEKAQIGTLHSFAAHLLRLYPIESRVDPKFQEDDGSRFESYFNQEWEFWLDQELGMNGSNHVGWKEMLVEISLPDIRQLAFAISHEIVSLDELLKQVEEAHLPHHVNEWFSAKRTRVAELLHQYERTRKRKIEIGLVAAHEVLDDLLKKGLNGGGIGAEGAKEALNMPFGTRPTGWDHNDFLEARRLIALARGLLSVDTGMIKRLIHILLPFVTKVRAGFTDEGWMTFDGLLARARALLREYPPVRERLKKEYQAILVDEFQDTDPIQYEIVLYLAERAGRCGAEWQNVELAAGRLFIVGDPKQSIYAFRRADLEAFDQVVRKVKDSGGMICELATNFRSHQEVLNVVNATFGRVLKPKENIQPANVPLMTRPNRKGCVTRPGVELQIVQMENPKESFDSAAATRLEADRLARWIHDDLLGKEVLTDAHGQSIPLRPGHIGLLFRKLTQAQDYLEALRRYDIPYVTDGEKHYYRRQEVIDFINVLRVIENPSDTIGLMGLLRSPLGGLMDREIYELRQRGAFDYRQLDRLEKWKSPRVEGVCRLYGILKELNHVALTISLPAVIELLFARLPIIELAASSLHGEQAVANLDKIRGIAASMVDDPHMSLTKFVDLLIERLTAQHEEAEQGLAEESLEAVRVLTIHKAKGLEFPVVILPGLHHGANLSNRLPPVSHDWATGALGISVGERCTLGAVLTREKSQVKEEAEQRRVLYVAMTRARERIILSSGYPDRLARGSFLGFLQEVADTDIGQPAVPDVRIGEVRLPQSVLSQVDSMPSKRKSARSQLRVLPSQDEWVHGWNLRERAWSETLSRRLFFTPSSFSEAAYEKEDLLRKEKSTEERGKLIGTLAHRVLEIWDFSHDVVKLQETIEQVCRHACGNGYVQDAAEIQEELIQIFQSFFSSPPYHRLQKATILGRELPFQVPWDCSDGPNQAIKHSSGVMEGIIDLVYRLDGQVWIADYKTDRVEQEVLSRWAAKYETQAKIYREAAARCLGLSQVKSQLLFLRAGASIEI